MPQIMVSQSFLVSLSSQFHYDSHGQIQGTEAFVRDITDRKNAEEMINRLAFYDPLTNLPNRRLLHEVGAVTRMQNPI